VNYIPKGIMQSSHCLQSSGKLPPPIHKGIWTVNYFEVIPFNLLRYNAVIFAESK
jgi:hypothetical protein